MIQNLLYLLWTNHSNLDAQSYYVINGTIFFLGIIQSFPILNIHLYLELEHPILNQKETDFCVYYIPIIVSNNHSLRSVPRKSLCRFCRIMCLFSIRIGYILGLWYAFQNGYFSQTNISYNPHSLLHYIHCCLK